MSRPRAEGLPPTSAYAEEEIRADERERVATQIAAARESWPQTHPAYQRGLVAAEIIARDEDWQGVARLAAAKEERLGGVPMYGDLPLDDYTSSRYARGGYA